MAGKKTKSGQPRARFKVGDPVALDAQVVGIDLDGKGGITVEVTSTGNRMTIYSESEHIRLAQPLAPARGKAQVTFDDVE